MKIKVLKRTPNELRIEIEGEGHTFCTLLQNALLEDEMVDMAGYDIPHPLVSNPVLYVRTKEGKRPINALRDASRRIRDRYSEFRKLLEEALGAGESHS